MTNREKLLKTNIYDTMKTMESRLINIADGIEMTCPVYAISGKYPQRQECYYATWSNECGECIQKWLNKEATA